ncbi:immunoglobulin domain-containing protein, partial [Aequorivita echinoideorum]|nr:hypothetical protein [Aequorivita echinoideorum]
MKYLRKIYIFGDIGHFSDPHNKRKNMKKIYTFLVIFVLFTLTIGAQNCASLDILTTTSGSVCGGGSVSLSATSSGTGDGILWYDAASGGNVVFSGSTFSTPPLSTTTSFWATEIIGTFTAGSVGPVDNSFGPGSGTSAAITTYHMQFDVLQPTNLTSIDIFPTASIGSTSSIEIRDSGGATIINVPYTTTVTGGSTAQTIPLNVNLSPGTGYIMGQVGPIGLFRNTSGASYPYTSTYINITGNNFGAGYYYYFYNWQYGEINVTCESPREEVIATVDNMADLNVSALPYTHTANTATYFNNYAGAPGADCGSPDSYLAGNDVVYKYTADDDYILSVELSGLSDAYSGVFIYDSCGDIGTMCSSEGSFNETTGTHGFQIAVSDTQDYYIVVSSADPTQSFDYTLTINGVTCANYPAPTGAGSQNFTLGQTLADLDVTGTSLTWYSDAATTVAIPSNTALVNGTTYYVTQSFQSCEGNPLAVTVTEVPCTGLDVVSTTPGSVCGEGSVTLSAQGAGTITNSDIYWYDAPTGGNLLGKGEVFETPALEQTTSFWASEVAISGATLPGQAFANPTVTSTSTLSNYGLIFNLTEGITLVDVEVFSTTAAGGSITIELRDINNANSTVATATATIPGGGTTAAPISAIVPLNFNIPPGDYRLLKTAGPGMATVTSSNNSFPYAIGTSGQVTSGSFATGTSVTYYYFYNWTIFEGQVLCESSPREEVIATVNEVANEMVTEPLPFVHTANTSTYGNNYSGTPGNDCNTTGNFLDGDDVVYQFSPTTGAVYSVQLSGLSSNNASLFVYRSCYDIGTACYAGTVSDGTTSDFGLDEVPMYDGFNYFIVVSTSDSPSTDYTLTIDVANINCADYTAAPEGDANQFFQTGEMLSDLVVNGGNLTWYSDAAGTTVIPDTTLLVDGTTYYVRQTLNGCPSGLLAITVTKIVCDDLEILSTVPGTIVCKGSTTLEAVGNGGLGTEIFWYDAASGGDRVAIGPNFTTPELTATTSYWAAEVFIEGDAPQSGQAKPAPTSTTTTTLSSYGLQFDVTQPFTLVSVDVYPTSAGTMDLELRDASGAVLETLPGINVPGGDGQTPQTIVLNLEIPVGNGLRLIKTSTTPTMVRESSGNSYPYPIGTFGQVTGGALNQGTPLSAYYWFYNWTIGSGQVLCESPREEVVATVSQDGDIIVPPALPYIDANNNTSNYGNTFTAAPGSGCGST